VVQAGEDNEVLWLLADHQGTIRDVAVYDAVLDETAVVNHLEYDAFGNLESQGDLPSFTYTGREWDDDAELYYYRARWYDAATGRFLSEDPLGFAAGDPNLSRYVGNSPLNFVDPSGLSGGVDDFGEVANAEPIYVRVYREDYGCEDWVVTSVGELRERGFSEEQIDRLREESRNHTWGTQADLMTRFWESQANNGSSSGGDSGYYTGGTSGPTLSVPKPTLGAGVFGALLGAKRAGQALLKPVRSVVWTVTSPLRWVGITEDFGVGDYFEAKDNEIEQMRDQVFSGGGDTVPTIAERGMDFGAEAFALAEYAYWSMKIAEKSAGGSVEPKAPTGPEAPTAPPQEIPKPQSEPRLPLGRPGEFPDPVIELDPDDPWPPWDRPWHRLPDYPPMPWDRPPMPSLPNLHRRLAPDLRFQTTERRQCAMGGFVSGLAYVR
jgi:RHS repeat-associated protein